MLPASATGRPAPPASQPFEPVCSNNVEVRLVRFYMPDDDRHVPYYHFKVMQYGRETGHVNFRAANTPSVLEYDGHIGYEIFPRYRGQRLSQQAVSLLLPFIAQHGFNSIVLTCHPDNRASARIIEALGGIYRETRSFPHVRSFWGRQRNIYHLSLPVRS